MNKDDVERVLGAVNKLMQIEAAAADADGIEEWLFDSKLEAEAALEEMRFVGKVWEFELKFAASIVDAESHLGDLMESEDAGKWILHTYCETRVVSRLGDDA